MSPSVRCIRTRASFAAASARRVARGPGCHHGRRDARPGNDLAGDQRLAKRVTSCSARCIPAARPARWTVCWTCFPVDQREQIRVMVSESLRGIVSQQLVPRADGKGRVLALEVLINSPAVGATIREAKTYMLPGIIQTGRKQGMMLMDESPCVSSCVARSDSSAKEEAISRADGETDDAIHAWRLRRFADFSLLRHGLHRPSFSTCSSRPRRLTCTSDEGEPPKIRMHGEIVPDPRGADHARRGRLHDERDLPGRRGGRPSRSAATSISPTR